MNNKNNLKSSIFLSHSSKDKLFAHRLKSELEKNGVIVWMDDEDLGIGHSLFDRIGQAITKVKFFIIVMSENAITSPWVQSELKVALNREMEEKRTFILPVLIEDIELPAFLKEKIYGDFRSGEKFDDSLCRLLKVCRDEDTENTAQIIYEDKVDVAGRNPKFTNRVISFFNQAISGVRRYKYLCGIAFALVLISVIWVSFLSDRIAKWTKSRPTFQDIKVKQLTYTGNNPHAAISPDGNFIAYVKSDNIGRQSLWTRQKNGTSDAETQIIGPQQYVKYWGLTFSNDGNNNIYYVTEVRGEGEGTRHLYRVSVLGGDIVPIIDDIDSLVTFSPDGHKIAFVRWVPNEIKSGLWILDLDSKQLGEISNSPEFEVFYGTPAWSPDGQTIACPIIDSRSQYETIASVHVPSGDLINLTSKHWQDFFGRVAWFAGDGLVINAKDQDLGTQIWYVSYPDGEAKPITKDPSIDYLDLTLIKDSTELVTIQSTRQSNVYVAPKRSNRKLTDEQLVKVTDGTDIDGINVSWMPDGSKILYDSFISGKFDIRMMNKDGSGQKRLTFDSAADGHPIAWFDPKQPERKYVVFTSTQSNASHIWRMDIDGRNPIPLSDKYICERFAVTPDGLVIYDTPGNARGLREISIDGGETKQIGNSEMFIPTLSPDGKRLAYWYWPELNDERNKILGIMRLDDEVQFASFKPLRTASSDVNMQWSTDGKSILYVDNDDLNSISNIWSQSTDDGKINQITNFKKDLIFGFAYSPDDNQLALTRGSIKNDIKLITNLKP